MGIFDRRKKPEVVEPVAKRSNEQDEHVANDSGYSLPTALSFLSSKNASKNILNLSAGFAAIDLISNKIASIPIVVKTLDGVEVDHPFNSVFDKTVCSKFITMKQLIWDTLVYGNGLCYIKRDNRGVATDLVYIPSGMYSIMYNSQTRDLYYLIPSISDKKIEPVNVVHILKNSFDGVNGKPVSYYARKAINLAAAAESTATDFFDSGCAISGLVKSNKPLSTQQKLDIKQSWREAHVQGEPNGLAVLGNDLTYEQIGANSAESQLLESRKYSVREIARFLGIQPELIGDEANKAYNSLQQCVDALISFTLSPFIMILEDEFNRKCLLPSERALLKIDFKEEDLRMPDETARAQALNALVAGGIMTPNEARESLGLPRVEGGDALKSPEKVEAKSKADNKQDNTNTF